MGNTRDAAGGVVEIVAHKELHLSTSALGSNRFDKF